jgi:hypothetical protein
MATKPNLLIDMMIDVELWDIVLELQGRKVNKVAITGKICCSLNICLICD